MNKLHKNLLSATLSLTLPLAALFSTAPASADVKTYSGSVCQATYGSQEGDLYKYTTSIYNVATGYRWITCAVARDRLNSTAGDWITYVYVEPANANQRTYCYLDEARVNGAIAQRNASSRLGEGWIALNTTFSESYGSRALYCYVPPKGFVNHLRIYEFNTFD